MSNLVDLARDVEKAREALDRAINALRAATGLSISAPRPRATRSAPQSGGVSNVSQAVLAAIQASPTGLPRAELTPLGSAGAVHSALKMHKQRGSIVNRDGRWVAAAKPVAKAKGPRQ